MWKMQFEKGNMSLSLFCVDGLVFCFYISLLRGFHCKGGDLCVAVCLLEETTTMKKEDPHELACHPLLLPMLFPSLAGYA